VGRYYDAIRGFLPVYFLGLFTDVEVYELLINDHGVTALGNDSSN
jgi:hypothetical protein